MKIFAKFKGYQKELENHPTEEEIEIDFDGNIKVLFQMDHMRGEYVAVDGVIGRGEPIGVVVFGEQLTLTEEHYTTPPAEVQLELKKELEADTKALKEAAIPLIKYLNENFHPHVTAIVTPTGVEVLEGKQSVQNITEFLRD